jgi:S1-C subfamily serine protease
MCVCVQVVRGSPADHAGIVSGDIIVEIDRAAVSTREQVQRRVGQSRPGDRLTLRLGRLGHDAKRMDVKARVKLVDIVDLVRCILSIESATV